MLTRGRAVRQANHGCRLAPSSSRARRHPKTPVVLIMKPVLPVFLVVTHLAVGVAPALDAHGVAAANEPAAWERLDRRLRQAGDARVGVLARETPGSQLLVQPGWLHVQSPRASADGLYFAGVRGPGRPDLGDTLGYSWEQVDEIRVRVSHSARGAAVGGVLGIAFGLAASSISVGLDSASSDDQLRGVAVGLTLGMLLGTAFGSLNQEWVKVYP